jgi:hypothetical protein
VLLVELAHILGGEHDRDAGTAAERHKLRQSDPLLEAWRLVEHEHGRPRPAGRERAEPAVGEQAEHQAARHLRRVAADGGRADDEQAARVEVGEPQRGPLGHRPHVGGRQPAQCGRHAADGADELVRLQLRTLGHRAGLASVRELAALAHLPADQSIPGLVRAGARAVTPPPGGATDGKPLGVDRDGRPVRLGVEDARHHLHLLGPTGVGKSTLIAQLALADLAAGRGCVVIDPAGDLVDDLLARIPENRLDRVDLLDPLDPAPPGLNMFDGEDRDLVVDQLVGIFARVFARHWGPRSDDILRTALLTLCAAPEPMTLVEVPRLLTDARWRAQLVLDLNDPIGLEPFWRWYDALSEAGQMQTIAPLLNKLRAFLLRRPVRAIIGQHRTTLDIPRCLDEGRLLLARLPKGRLGEDTSSLLGSLLVARVWQATTARAAAPPHERRDCTLLIDEVQNFLNLPMRLADILAEARKYRLSLGLAHQYLGQLRPELRDGLTNARTKIYFQLSPEDAGAVRAEVRPELDDYDLERLPAHSAAVRLCQAGTTTSAFTMATEPLAAGSPEHAAQVRAASRRRIGTARTTVEDQLAERHGRGALK